MRLEAAIEELVADLPWAENVRLVVGPLGSREAVKDLILARAEIAPAWISGSLVDLARDILNKNKVSVDKPLSVASQCDVLEWLAGQAGLKSLTPELCTHLKTRPVAKKISRFVTALERTYVDEGELDAVVDCLKEREPGLGDFVSVVASMWRQGQFVPWGEGDAERRFLHWLEENPEAVAGARALPRRLWLWGFAELTPLEEAVLGALAARGLEIRLLVPEDARAILAPRAEALGVGCEALDESRVDATVWAPHSVWDEVEFLRDELEKLRAKGIAWRDIAIFVPDDDLYKRFVRLKLSRWNVPLRDPSLTDAWKDNGDWLWWRDLLATAASGLKLDDVRAWLGSGAGRHELFEAAYKQAVHGGARQWARLSARHELPELKLLVEAVGLLARAMSTDDFRVAVESLVARATVLLGARPGADALLEFGARLCDRNERPHLEGYRARLPRFVPLFEEFLEGKARAESVRSDGVQFVKHGAWLPATPSVAFVLGANTLTRARPSADLWDWEAVEARRIWNRVHFGFTYEERARLEETTLRHGLRGQTTILSGTRHDVSGAILPEAALFKRLRGDLSPTLTGGHAAVGWTKARRRSAADPVVRKDRAPQPGEGQPPLRVSSFEDYLKCPFIYYGRHILGLEPERELGLDADARARGTVLHEVLERFIRQEINGEAPALSAETRAEALARLRLIVGETVGRRPLEGMYRHKPLVDKAGAAILAEATRFLDWEIANRAEHPSVKPFAVEKAIELELPGGYRVKGKLDRVDSDGRFAVVVDYKTGQAPFVGRELLDGIGTQLLMYARGVQASDGLEPGVARYLSLGRKPNGKSGVFLKKHLGTLHSTHPRNTGLAEGEFGEIYDRASERWKEAAARLAAGDFAPRPARPTKDCPACQYRDICGYDELPDDGIEEDGS